MKQSTICMPAMQAMEFSVTKVMLDAASALNQNDSHIHSVCEVYINLSGDVNFAVENRLYAVSRGTVIITMPYEYHHCIYRSDVPHEHFWITFPAQREQDFLKLFFDREKGINNCIDLDETALNEVCSILDALLEHEGDGLDYRLRILRFFRILSNAAGREPMEERSSLPKDVADALAYMDAHLQEDVAVERLAAAGGVSVNTLERHFRDSLHTTPVAFLRRKRLYTSIMHLKSGCSVTEAALKSGFQDGSNYIQLFRKQFGITPGKYKKKLGADAVGGS